MNELIFQPMIAVVTLTAVVWVVLYVTRIRAMRRAGKPAQAYTVPDRITEFLPEKANYPANNFKNLFELPVLFYVAILLSLLLMIQDGLLVQLAWGFVILRIAHSVIHCTYNNVNHRFAAYALSCLFLLFMWIRLASFILTS